MLKLLVLFGALVAVAVNAQSSNKGGWVLGKAGLDCNAVCSAAGGPSCLRRSLRSVNTAAKWDAVALQFSDVKRGARSPNSPLYAPAYHRTSKFSYIDLEGKSTCSQVPPPLVRRLCCCSDTPCPPDFNDCLVSEWSSYDACTQSCGTGAQTRTREVTRINTPNGAACPSLEDTQACNTFDCPIDCAVSEWGSWDECTLSCGTGMSTRSRSVTQADMYGGMTCPELEDTMTCNTFDCPIDCVVSEWSDWNECTVSCGTEGGMQTRTRSVLINEEFAGLPCPGLEETQGCNAFECPADCTVSQWSSWSSCSKSCGSGFYTRARSVIEYASYGGMDCPALTEDGNCNVFNCPQDCTFNSWSAWSSCSATCNTGTQTRTRTIKTQASFGGNCPTNPVLTATQNCNTQFCPTCTSQTAGSRPNGCPCSGSTVCQSGNCQGGFCAAIVP